MSQSEVSHESQGWQFRLAQIMDTMRDLSKQTDPQSMVHEYYARMRSVNPHIDRRMALSRRGLEYPQYRVTRYSEWKENIDPWKDQGKLPLLSGGILADLIYGNEPRIINDLVVDPNDPAAEYLSDQRSLQAIPLLDQGKSLNMSLHTRRIPDGFSYEHLPEAVWLANLFGRATSNLVLARQLKAAYDEIDRELKAVARIQQSLLPSRLPEIPRMKLAAHYRTARRAGGDYYDFFPLINGKWGLLIADVAGHGTPAAVMMAVMHSIAHNYPGNSEAPSQMLSFLNQKICEFYAGANGTFVTAFYGIFDPRTLQLNYSSAGHNPPRLRSGASREIQSLDQAQNLPLGIFPNYRNLESSVTMNEGDQLVLYTDGIVECMSSDRELFGLERLDSLLSGCSVEPQEIITSLIHVVEEFSAVESPADDQTVVVARID